MPISRTITLAVAICVAGLGSSACVQGQQDADSAANGDAKKAKNGDEDKAKDRKKPAKTLFEWAIGPQEEEKNGNGAEEPPKRIDPDRPHFPEASSTVGLGRVVLESGYTFNGQGGSFHAHSYPEANLRIGMFADWFELRIQQNYLSQAQTVDGARSTNSGFQDLSLGVKLALTEQKQCLPESAIILQMTVPSGLRAFSSGRVQPGVNYDFSWELIKDKLSLEGVISANSSHVLASREEHPEVGVSFVQFATGLSVVYDFTRNFQGFAEWYGLYAAGSGDEADVGPQHYAVAGFLYYFSDNFFIDFRAGVGLNEHANDYLLGSGFAIRY